MVRQVTSIAVVKNHVQVVGSLETVVHLDDKRMFSLFENVALGDCVLQVFVLIKECLLQHFHCINLILTLESAFEHLSESTVA